MYRHKWLLQIANCNARFFSLIYVMLESELLHYKRKLSKNTFWASELVASASASGSERVRVKLLVGRRARLGPRNGRGHLMGVGWMRMSHYYFFNSSLV